MVPRGGGGGGGRRWNQSSLVFYSSTSSTGHPPPHGYSEGDLGSGKTSGPLKFLRCTNAFAEDPISLFVLKSIEEGD